MEFVMYDAVPRNVDDVALIEEWKERATFIQDDLHKLLQMDHKQFWQQVIQDESLNLCIDSYLKNAPRCSDAVYQLAPDVKQLQNELHRLVYVVCVRMATNKESKHDHMPLEEFGRIIYDNYIFDIPKLMDICSLYGRSNENNQGNKPLLTKMMNNIFQAQPQYMGDLESVIPTILQVFETMCSRCGLSQAGASPQKIEGAKMVLLDDMATADVEDLVFCLHDSIYSVWLFLDVFPPASAAFTKHDTLMKFACTYELLFPALMTVLDTWSEDDYPYLPILIHQVRECQLHMLKVCHLILSHNYLTPLLSHSTEEEAELYIEGYLHHLTAMLTERRFLCHLQTLYPFHEDRDILLQSRYPVDETRLQYIVDAINEAIFIYTPQKERKSEEVVDVLQKTEDPAPKIKCSEGGRRFSPEAIDSMITSIKDLLPDLGDGFIQCCLKETDYNTEETLNMLLEDNVPSSLKHMPRDMPKLEYDDDVTLEQPDVLAERRNVFENDEFDIFSRDSVDMNRIHRGKKEKNLDVVLGDKQVVEDLRPLFDKYGHEDVESMYDTHYVDYEDEYDDTYDTNNIGAADADNLDELTNRRIFRAPNNEPESEESEEETTKRRGDFVEDPAKVRERLAARHATKEYNRNRGRGRGGMSHNVPPQSGGMSHNVPPQSGPNPENSRKTYDVKGNVKGQGQSSDVLRNRGFKEKHKSSRGNHNRRNLADKKRRV